MKTSHSDPPIGEYVDSLQAAIVDAAIAKFVDENADLRRLINYLTVCRIAESCGGVADDKTKNMIADLRRKLEC